MKKITLLLFCGLFSMALFAQEQEFNRWSVELEAGVHKPGRPMAAGHFTTTPSFFQGSLGVRYMLTNRFGLKLGVGYHQFEGNEDGSLPFQSRYMRYSLQGVANLGDILNFRSWSNTINVLVHAGGGYSRLTPLEPVEKDADQMGHFIAGITPQLRLTDHIALTGDLSAIGTLRQNYTWDGTGNGARPGFDGLLINGSVGLTFYLGSAEKHADWYAGDPSSEVLDSLSQRVSSIEDKMVDSDQDGVANYLDQEPNTTNGVAVNSKGVAVDKNGNGIPDELEDDLDARYASTTGNTTTTGGGMISDLLNNGYVNVYFKFDSTEPETYSLNAINMCITYMRENPSAEAELIGYADEIGNPDYNAQLSEARAQKVYDIMVAAGIDGERLSVTGNGEDASVDKGSKPARQLVRRVTFKLK
ncbi:MAG TPA: OmpA family protein [Flavobacteriaceae bacterium]|nr:OmpA family protein [Flavobacteriaceae bacterium]